MRRAGERKSESVREPSRGLPRRSVQRFGGRVFGRSHQAFHRALPVAVRSMPSGRASTSPPAMASGLSETVMDWSDIVEAMDADQPAKKRGPYKKSLVA
jgi:hypothetical protein